MHKKLIVILIGLILLLGGELAGAGEKQDAKANNKHSVSSGKCWKRTWLPSEALMGRSTMPVCKAFEKVLNTTCEFPEKLECNWTLPMGEKEFKKLTWRSLDPKEYWGLIQDIALSGWAEQYRAGQWEKIEPEYKKELDAGLLQLKVATVDIDHDGQVEEVVLLRNGLCGKAGWHDGLGIINPETKRIDWKFWHLLLGPNASEGGNIMLHDGKAYMFGWDYSWNVAMVWDGLINICQFKYTKGGNR
jgi:hypothetical protein